MCISDTACINVYFLAALHTRPSFRGHVRGRMCAARMMSKVASASTCCCGVGLGRDMTGGAQSWVDTNYPGAFYKPHGVSYVCVGGKTVTGKQRDKSNRDEAPSPSSYAFNAYTQARFPHNLSRALLSLMAGVVAGSCRCGRSRCDAPGFAALSATKSMYAQGGSQTLIHIAGMVAVAAGCTCSLLCGEHDSTPAF